MNRDPLNIARAPFNPSQHTQPDALANTERFRLRVALRSAVIAHLKSLKSELLPLDVSIEPGRLAEQLAFLPKVKSGWGPTEQEVQETAKHLVDGYLAHCKAFAGEGFAAPWQAALTAMAEFDIVV